MTFTDGLPLSNSHASCGPLSPFPVLRPSPSPLPPVCLPPVCARSTLATHYYAPLYLTLLLLPRLRASAPSRVVNVASFGEAFGRVHWDDLRWGVGEEGGGRWGRGGKGRGGKGRGGEERGGEERGGEERARRGEVKGKMF